MREEAKKLEEKVQAFNKLKDMEQRVGDLEKELHWAIVYEIEAVHCVFVLSLTLILMLLLCDCLTPLAYKLSSESEITGGPRSFSVHLGHTMPNQVITYPSFMGVQELLVNRLTGHWLRQPYPR